MRLRELASLHFVQRERMIDADPEQDSGVDEGLLVVGVSQIVGSAPCHDAIESRTVGCWIPWIHTTEFKKDILD